MPGAYERHPSATEFNFGSQILKNIAFLNVIFTEHQFLHVVIMLDEAGKPGGCGERGELQWLR